MRSTTLALLLVATACGGDDAAQPIDAGLDGEVGTIVEPGDPGAADVRVDVRVDRERATISPLLYGVNGGADVARDRPTVQRSGGNRLTAYNWENNASNAGSDYCFQNDRTFGGPGSAPAAAYRELLDDARARGTAALVTVPIVDHVAADHDDRGDGGQGPPACVGDVRNSGADYLDTRFVANVARKGSPFAATPDTGDRTVYQDEAIDFVRRGWSDVRVLVDLDNEPDLWSSTHARIHPAPVTYAELLERTTRFAAAVKDAWPTAEVLGFVSYGFAGYETLQNAPDAGGRRFLPFFLDGLRAAEATAGHRLVDYLDLHWYPEARGDGVRISDVADGAGAAARVQAPRSLWDPTYREDSWIATTSCRGRSRSCRRCAAISTRTTPAPSWRSPSGTTAAATTSAVRWPPPTRSGCSAAPASGSRRCGSCARPRASSSCWPACGCSPATTAPATASAAPASPPPPATSSASPPTAPTTISAAAR
jgi:hypothetical protein